MAEALSPFGRLWAVGLFLLSMAVVLFAALLPLPRSAGALPGPELMFPLAAVWTMRRPGVVPFWVMAAVFLVADLLLMRPLALHTALALIALDVLRSRSVTGRTSNLVQEWWSLALVLTAMTLAEAAILTLFLVPQPGLGLWLIRLGLTIAAYPVVVMLAARPFGLKPRRESDRDLIVGRTA